MGLHHVELWVPSLARAVESWGWLLESLGWTGYQDWPGGRSWRDGDVYVVVEESPALSADTHDRLRPGLNHLAFHAGVPGVVGRAGRGRAGPRLDADVPRQAPLGRRPEHYAAYLEDRDGFEVELVAI